MANNIVARNRDFSDLATTNPTDYFDPRTVNPPPPTSTSSYSSVHPHPSTPLKVQKSFKSLHSMKPYGAVGSMEAMSSGEIQKKRSVVATTKGSILGDGEDDAGKTKIQMEDSAELLEEEEAMKDLGKKTTMRICRICSREFPSGRALGGHMRVHGASQLIMADNNVALQSSYSCSKDGGTCMKNKSDRVEGLSEDNIIVNQKDELFTEMIRKHRNRISYVSHLNPQLMSSAEEENDDQRQSASVLKKDLAMEREEEVEDASVAEFASRDIVSFSSSQCTASEDINLGNHGDGDLKQKIHGESADLINGKKRICNPNLYELRRNPKPNLRFIRSTPNSDQQLLRKSANCMINSALASSSSSINSSASAPAPATAQNLLLKRSKSNSSSAMSASSSPSPERVSNGAKPHACTECGKSFFSWKALFGHMRCHPEREWRGINRPSDQQHHQHKRRRMRTVLNSFTSSLQRARSIDRSARNSSSAIIDAEASHSHSHSHDNQSFKNGTETVNRGDLTHSFSTDSIGEGASFVKEEKDAIKTSSLSELISSHHAEYQAAEHEQVLAAEEKARINSSGKKRMNTSVSNSLVHIKRRRTMAMVELAPKGEKSNADQLDTKNVMEPAEGEEEEEQEEQEEGEIEEDRSRSSAPNISTNISFSDINIKDHGYGENNKVSASSGQKSRNSAGKRGFFARNSSSCSSTHESQVAGFNSKERSSMQMNDNDGEDDQSYMVSDFWSPCWPTRCKRRSNLRGRHSSEYRFIKPNDCNQARTDSSNNIAHKFPADADDNGHGEDGQLIMEVEMQEDVDMANCLVLLSGSGMSKSSSTVVCRPVDAGAGHGTRRRGRRRGRGRGRRKARRSVMNCIAANMADDGDGKDGDGDDDDDKMDDSNDLFAVDAKNEVNGDGEEEIRALAMEAVKSYHCATCNRSFSSHQALGGHRASHRKTRGCYAAAQSLHKDCHDLQAHHLNRSDHQNAITDLGRIHHQTDADPSSHHHADLASSCSAIESNPKKEFSKLAIAHADPIQPVHEQLITITTSSSCSQQHPLEPAAKESGVKKKIVAQAMNCDSSYRRGGSHECSVCHRIFPSGQALGGHKRCHWITTSPNINSNHGDGEDANDQKLFSTNLSELDDQEHHRISANLDSDSIAITTANYTEVAHSNDLNYHCSNEHGRHSSPSGISYFQNSCDDQLGLMRSAATNYHSSNVTADDQLLRSRSVNSRNDEDTSILLLDLNLPAPVDYNHSREMEIRMEEMNQSDYIMNMQKDYVTMTVQDEESSDHAGREQFMPLQFCVARDSSSSSSPSLFGLISH